MITPPWMDDLINGNTPILDSLHCKSSDSDLPELEMDPAYVDVCDTFVSSSNSSIIGNRTDKMDKNNNGNSPNSCKNKSNGNSSSSRKNKSSGNNKNSRNNSNSDGRVEAMVHDPVLGAIPKEAQDRWQELELKESNSPSKITLKRVLPPVRYSANNTSKQVLNYDI